MQQFLFTGKWSKQDKKKGLTYIWNAGSPSLLVFTPAISNTKALALKWHLWSVVGLAQNKSRCVRCQLLAACLGLYSKVCNANIYIPLKIKSVGGNGLLLCSWNTNRKVAIKKKVCVKNHLNCYFCIVACVINLDVLQSTIVVYKSFFSWVKRNNNEQKMHSKKKKK